MIVTSGLEISVGLGGLVLAAFPGSPASPLGVIVPGAGLADSVFVPCAWELF